MACLGGLVVNRAARSDVTFAFIAFYMALVFGRSLWLGEPLDDPAPSARERRAAALHVLHDLGSAGRRRTRARAGSCSRCSSRSARGTSSSGCSGPTGSLWSLAVFSLHGAAHRSAPAGRRATTGRVRQSGALDARTEVTHETTDSGSRCSPRRFAWLAARRSAPSAASTSPRPTRSCSTRRRRSCSCATATAPSDDGERLQRAIRRSSRSSSRCRRCCRRIRSTSATRRCSITSTPIRRRGWSSTSTRIRAGP